MRVLKILKGYPMRVPIGSQELLYRVSLVAQVLLYKGTHRSSKGYPIGVSVGLKGYYIGVLIGPQELLYRGTLRPSSPII